jgi:hypothetical protein
MVVTFLVTSDFAENATILDNLRLGKQRVESFQIIKALEEGTGWKNHPIVKSWSGYVPALKVYYNSIITEWVSRGFKNNMPLYELSPGEEITHPPWIYEKKVQYAMLSQLIQKNSDHYNPVHLAPLISPQLLEHVKSLPPEYLEYGYIWPNKYTLEQIQTLPLAELAEPFVQRVFCIAVGCHSKASYGKHCGHHRDKSVAIVKCNAFYKNGNPCRNKSRYGEERCGVHSRN